MHYCMLFEDLPGIQVGFRMLDNDLFSSYQNILSILLIILLNSWTPLYTC